MKDLFIGIDLGIESKKSSAICVLKEKNKKIFPLNEWCQKCEDLLGKKVFERLKPYLKKTKVIAIDAPLTLGKGKGKMRLFEKFFSKDVFRKEKINPVALALIPKVLELSLKLRKQLEKKGFILNIDLIETSSRLLEAFLPLKNFRFQEKIEKKCQTKNQKSAFLSALLAFLHSKNKTRYFGYKDGFLFLPEISLWKKEWQKKFYLVWKNRPRLKYYRLKTNIFQKIFCAII